MAGEIVHFAGASAPVGWLKCNGAAVSRSTYAALFAALGTVYGAGDGTTTFNLPDYRGEFLRGLDDGRGVDASRTLGSFQADDFKAHSHTDKSVGGGGGVPADYVAQGGSWPRNSASTTGNAGGTETRPRNVAALVLIKY